MPKIPASAAHLNSFALVPWMKLALGELGTREVSGPKSNPRILEYRKLAGIELGGEDSAVPWCAIFVNAMLAQAGIKTSGSAMARSFTSSKNFEKLDAPIVGCIVVISSSRGPASGHVFFYTGENGLFIQGVGGNQNDEVNISMFQKKVKRNGKIEDALVGYYWPVGAAKPASPFDKPVRLARPLLPHEKTAVRDA